MSNEATNALDPRQRLVAIVDQIVEKDTSFRRVRKYILSAIDSVALRTTAEGYVEGLSAQVFQAAFLDACHHRDGSDYSDSQRAVCVRQFNEIGRCWHEAGLLPQPLQVRNYRRDKQRGVLDPYVFMSMQPCHLERLRKTFLQELGTGQASSQPGALWEAWCQLVFALIAFAGMCWPGCFADITRLPWKDVLTAGRGFIRISRAGGWQRLYVEDVVVVCALALALAVPNPDLETKVCPCQTSLKQLRAHFNSWLAQLCRRANVPPVTVEILAHASYLRLNDIYPNIVVGAILGQILYSPVPDDQADVFESYRQPFVLPDQSASIAAHQDDAQTEVAVSPPPNRRVVEASPVGEMAEKLIRELRDRCRPLFATTRSANRKTVVSELEAYAVEQIDCLNATIAPNVPDVKAILPAICQHLAEAGNTENTLRFNIACLALWLSHVAGQRNRAGNTIAACCSDGVNLLRLFPDLCLNELSEEEGEDILALDYAAKTKRRVLASWKSLHTFLSHLGLPVAGINWRQLAVSDRIRPVRLISQTDFQRLLAELAADGSPAAWNGFLAALLAYFAGLRVSEICRLRIEDVVLLDRPPFLRVRRSKRGKSRIVYLRYVPEEVVSLIRTHRDRRWRVTGEFGALLLVNERGEQLDPDALSKVVIEGMKRIGLRGEGQEESVVFHTLRHCCASRLLALHVDSPDITRMMGHSSPDTTARYYLHGFDFLQRERLREYRDPLLSQPELGYVSQDRAAQLLGVSRRHVRNLVARMTRQTGRSIDLLPHSKLFRKRRAGKEELYLSLQDLAILLAFRLTSKDDVLPSITAQSSTSPLA